MERRRVLWLLAAGGLGAGLAAVGIGSAMGGELGPMTTGYGLLVALAAVYMAVGLAIRDRAGRRLGVARGQRAGVTTSLQERRAG